jgi:hypothetical protein
MFSFWHSFWDEALPSDIIVSLKKEMVEEMKKRSTNHGLKLTSYNIYAHGTKPL